MYASVMGAAEETGSEERAALRGGVCRRAIWTTACYGGETGGNSSDNDNNDKHNDQNNDRDNSNEHSSDEANGGRVTQDGKGDGEEAKRQDPNSAPRSESI